jgi:VWFA-related protein
MAITASHRLHWPLLSLLLLCAGISPATAGGPADFTYRTNTAEVRLSFSALDQRDHAVATLQASDFAVVDKDVIVRNFQSFTRSDWTKLEIAILIDTSESVTPRLRQEIADILELVSQTAGIPDENLSIFSFDRARPAMLCAGDCRSSRVTEHLPDTRARGLTPLFDTIVFSSDYLARHGDAHAQKVVIVFSDGMDTISENSMSDAIHSSLSGEVELDCLDLNKPGDASQGANVLRSLANATGGRYFPPKDGVAHALNAILEGFRASYEVTYRLPSHASGFHEVRILPTHNLNLQFLSRSGYYYPNQVR